MAEPSTRAKGRALRSARVSTLKKCLTPPTLSETPVSDSKFKQWLELFHAARRETDEKKRRDRIEAAQKAIHERVLELAQESNDSTMEERWLIDVALTNLRSLLEHREAA